MLGGSFGWNGKDFIKNGVKVFKIYCECGIIEDMEMELLAPAGDFESLKAAVFNGANAVYLGVSKFNARNNIKGFGLDNLAEAVDFAHIYGIKVYLAVNILFRDDELQGALDLIKDANNLGVDAFIIQDLGLAYLIKKYYNSVEIHASTQMAVHNLEGVRALERLGFTRVVLARETSVHEIERIRKNSNIEIEFFVQGALCVSFSGNCYMCSHLVGKSGNRGVCQQFCRLPYTFEAGKTQKTGYLLSAKDICMLDELDNLKKAGVSSLKIEGRARRPFYVAQACKIYRTMLDSGKYSADDFDKLKIAFNREFTPAYFDGNGAVISKIQGNNGLRIGKVAKVNYGKKFNEVFISSNRDLSKQLGLKFCAGDKEMLSVGAYNIERAGKLYRFTTTAKVEVGWEVHITQDEQLEQSALAENKKLDIEVTLKATPNCPIKAKANLDETVVECEGEICEESKTIATSTEQVLKQMSRSEIFKISAFNCELNNCYILNSTINKLRNKLYEKLIEKILEKYQKNKLNNIKIEFNTIFKPKTFNFSIINDENIKLNNFSKNNILIYNYSNFLKNNFIEFDKKCKQLDCKGYIDLPPFATEDDIKLLTEIITETSLGVVANNLYAFGFDCDIIVGQFVNIYNSYSIEALKILHNFEHAFAEELTPLQWQKLNTNIAINCREKVYMTLLHCPFKQHLGGSCADCKCAEASYTMNNGKKFRICRKKTHDCVFELKD